ncbi:MAG: hypothetical protein JSS61_06340 [Verrucomicrobia bacterium]|nr:hypothetical protein [Verrucomicrobiota bacterium]
MTVTQATLFDDRASILKILKTAHPISSRELEDVLMDVGKRIYLYTLPSKEIAGALHVEVYPSERAVFSSFSMKEGQEGLAEEFLKAVEEETFKSVPKIEAVMMNSQLFAQVWMNLGYEPSTERRTAGVQIGRAIIQGSLLQKTHRH